MLNFLDRILYGIFTEPTTSVVAILIAAILFVVWLYVKQIKHSTEINRALVEEFKASNNRYGKVLEDHTSLDLKIKDMQIKTTELHALSKRILEKLDHICSRDKEKTMD